MWLASKKAILDENLQPVTKPSINVEKYDEGSDLKASLSLEIMPLIKHIDLSKIKVLKIFKWLKTKRISDQEMMRTFNCGVGFCLIVSKKNVNKIKNFFPKTFIPYEIGFISKSNKKVNLSNSLRW